MSSDALALVLAMLVSITCTIAIVTLGPWKEIGDVVLGCWKRDSGGASADSPVPVLPGQEEPVDLEDPDVRPACFHVPEYCPQKLGKPWPGTQQRQPRKISCCERGGSTCCDKLRVDKQRLCPSPWQS